jgi:hypothetical protein
MEAVLWVREEEANQRGVGTELINVTHLQA